MRTIQLVGVNQLGVAQKLGKDVISFVDTDKKISVVIIDDCTIQLTAAKGCYNLVKHPTLNVYWGVLNGCKVRVNLKATIGSVTYW